MKIFDMHIHATKTKPNPKALIDSMEKAGFYGGCVFSAPPKEHNIVGFGGGSTYEERVTEALGWCKGYEDRLFPVMWIHPHEENIIETVRRAVKDGIVAFKMICSDYYVYEERPLAVIKEIARLGVPIIFHTGILWDGNVSSSYNRPLNWEALLDIEGIKFSMGHCSWPWVDECIALYGKFLDARNRGKCVDMYFDLTPGTPRIYRQELLTKLYTIGYDVGDHVLFGTDSFAESWSDYGQKKRLDTDSKILDELGVSAKYRNKLFSENLMQFLGKTYQTEAVDDFEAYGENGWSAVNPNTKVTIEKWYKKLGFPSYYDEEFYEALHSIPVSDSITVESYDKKGKDGKRNLLSYLFLCEQTQRECEKIGLPNSVIENTLRDIVAWCINWSNVKGELYLGELEWLARHLRGNIFRLGRLQFCMASAHWDIPEHNVKKGDNVVEIHIPAGEHLTKENCQESIRQAKAFFEKYFPQFEYAVFLCDSWLLDDTLKAYLPEQSGIVQFGNMFDKVEAHESFAILKYLFPWNTTPLNVKHCYPTSSFAEKIQKAVLRGEKFYETLGVLKK